MSWCSAAPWKAGKRAPVPDIVRGDAEITKHLSRHELDLLFDTSYYTRYENVSLSRVFGD